MAVVAVAVRSKPLAWGFAFMLLNILDALLTKILLNLQMGAEANPLLSLIGNLVGTDAMLLIKVALGAAFLLLAYLLTRQSRWMLKAATAGMAIVVAWNLAWLIIGVGQRIA